MMRLLFNLLRVARLAACIGIIPLALAVTTHAQSDNEFHELESKYIFGSFTIGSSTGIEGERAIEPETDADFGKRGGHYGVTGTALELEYTPNQYVELEFGPTISYYDIQNAPGLDDRNMGSVNGLEAAFRSVVFDRGILPFALTFAAEPEFHARDETSGARVVNYGLETRLEADTELIKNRLFLGMNLLYEPETTRADLGIWNNESTWGASAALAYQIVPNVVIGADLWYLQHYDGIGFNTFTGDAVYLGPTLFWKISRTVLLSAAWQAQIAGHEPGSTPLTLDLTDFSRQRAKLLLEFEF